MSFKGANTLFRQMRRIEKLMTKEDTIRILTEGEYGTLATIGDNGYPYSVPLNYVYENGVIYFHSAPNGHKVENIQFNNKVSFSVVSYHQLLPQQFDTEYDSAIIYGKAFKVTADQEKSNALRLLIEKYSADYLEQGIQYIEKAMNAIVVFKIEIEAMTGKLGR